jgi:membrane dipeptidase
MRILFFVLLLGTQIIFSQNNYLELHKNALVIDTHADILLQVLRGSDISKKTEYGQVDLVRMQEGGVDVQVFAVWPNPEKYGNGGMYKQCNRMIDALENITNNNPDKIEIARSPVDIERIVESSKIGAFIGIEGGTAIENDLDKLAHFYNRGVRYLGLTWNDSPDWATSAKDEVNPKYKGEKGLTKFGKSIIKKMNEIGMIVDVSHSGEKTFYDVIENSTKPIIASHSCVYSLAKHYRNLKDDQLKALAKNGGAVFITFYPGYLDVNFDRKYHQLQKSSKAYLDSVQASTYNGNYLGYRKWRAEHYREKTKNYRPPVSIIVDHMDYIINLIGEDYVGLGSDFDGISITPREIEDVSKMPNITREMLKRGYSEKRIKKILGGNFMRIFKEVNQN